MSWWLEVAFIILLTDAAIDASIRAAVSKVEVVHGRGRWWLERAGILVGGGYRADGERCAEGSLCWNAREELGEGLGRYDGGVAEVFEFGFDRAD